MRRAHEHFGPLTFPHVKGALALSRVISLKMHASATPSKSAAGAPAAASDDPAARADDAVFAEQSAADGASRGVESKRDSGSAGNAASKAQDGADADAEAGDSKSAVGERKGES